MIVLLSCSCNWLKINVAYSSTGGLNEDSVLVSFDDLRAANAKMIELEYEKRINKELNNIISNDSVAISMLNRRIDILDSDYKRNIKLIKQQRNGLGIISIVLLILVLL